MMAIQNCKRFHNKGILYLIPKPPQMDPTPFQKELWSETLWKNLTNFLWIVFKHKILTCENLTKKGHEGPSWCCICKHQHDTMDHMLGSCELSHIVWNKITISLNINKRAYEEIIQTLRKCPKICLQSQFMNELCILTWMLLLWAIQKEWNQCILKKIIELYIESRYFSIRNLKKLYL